MKLIETRTAPNPRRVRIFLAEKGITVPCEEVDLMSGVLATEPYATLNPMRRVPMLVLGDGTVIAETVAICRYFEEVQPSPPLFGSGPVGRAMVEMWNRRIEFGLFAPIAHAFRHLNPRMGHLEVPQIAAWGEANKPKALEMLALLDARLAETPFAAGDDFSIADITAMVAIDFMKPARIALPEGLAHVARWRADVAARPSAAA